MTEREISREIDLFLKSIGCAVWSTEQGYRHERGGTRTSPGIPDKIVMHPDAWTFAEIKRPKGKLSDAQRFFRDEAKAANVPWELWTDATDAFDWAARVGLVVPA